MTITGLILAGGRCTRMEQTDKGLEPFSGQPMAQHVLTRLRPQVDHVFINANRNIDTYKQFGEPVYADALPDFAGPLAGLQTGLMHCTTPLLICAPCDSPFLPLNLVARLLAALTAADADLAVASCGIGPERRTHPVFCLLKTSLLSSLTTYLQEGGRKVSAWQATQNMIEVHFEDDAAFRNINSRDDLHRFEATPK